MFAPRQLAPIFVARRAYLTFLWGPRPPQNPLALAVLVRAEDLLVVLREDTAATVEFGLTSRCSTARRSGGGTSVAHEFTQQTHRHRVRSAVVVGRVGGRGRRRARAQGGDDSAVSVAGCGCRQRAVSRASRCACAGDINARRNLNHERRRRHRAHPSSATAATPAPRPRPETGMTEAAAA